MAMPDEVDTPRLAVLGVVGTVVILLIVFVVQVFYYHLSHELDAQRDSTTNQALARYYAEQEEKLHHLGWLDQKAGKVSIPIEQAIDLTLRDLTTPPAK